MRAVIYVARHGQSTWNVDSRIAGWLDPALTEHGRRQAVRLADVLCDVPLSAIYSSPLRRARDTATPVARAQGLEITFRDELKERHFGVLQGRHRDSRDVEARDLWARCLADPTAAPPGGESLDDLEHRVDRFVDDILAVQVGPILTVAHHHANRVLLGKLMGRDLTGQLPAQLESRHVYEILPGAPPRASRIDLDASGPPHRCRVFESDPATDP